MAGTNLNPDPTETGEGEPQDQRTVPLKALEDERHKRQSLENEAAELRGRVQGLTVSRADAPTHAAPAPKDLTPAELRVAVDEGRLDQGQADEIRDRQLERRVETRLAGQLETTLTERARVERASDELTRYRKAIPELADKSSDSFARVQTEFDRLIGYGDSADSLVTEVKAIRTAFGDIDKLENLAAPAEREAYTEIAGNAPAQGETPTDGWPKSMSAGVRRYYDDQIARGTFADRKAALAEWAYKPKHKPSFARAS
jgi:hypothetical protein